MAEDKKSFVLYSDLIHTVKKMPREKQGDLFMTILSYVNDQNPTVDDLMVELVFEPIKLQMKRDLIKYETSKERRKEAGRLAGLKSGESRKNNLEKGTKNEPIPTKRTNGSKNEPNEHVNANGTVNGNGTVTVTDILLKKETKGNTPNGVVGLENQPPDVKIDFNNLILFFNKNRGLLPEVKKLSDVRKKRLLSLEKQYGKKQIISVIEKTRDSHFLQGENKEGWVASFDWIFKPANFLKILEDNYAKRENLRGVNSSRTDADLKKSANNAVDEMFGISRSGSAVNS